MQIAVQFNFDSFEEFHAWVLRTTGRAPTVVADVPVSAEAPVSAAPGPEAPESVAARMARPRGRPRKNPEPVAPAPQVEPEPAAPAPSPAPVNDQPAPPVNSWTGPAPVAAAPTEADAKAVLERVFQARGFQGAQQVLQRLGVSRLRDLPADQYPALIAEAGKTE